MKDTNRMMLYINTEDRQQIETLVTELGKRGVNLIPKNKNEPSISQLFRYLRMEELKRLKIDQKTQK